MSTERFRCGVMIACVVVLGACGSSRDATAPASRTAAYLAAVERRIAAHADDTRFVLRHNPAACDCPPYEVSLGGTWQRAVLAGVDATDASVLAIEAAVDASPEAELTVEGALEGGPLVCARGALYVSLVPKALVAHRDPPRGAASPRADVCLAHERR